MNLNTWAERHGITQAAVNDLMRMLAVDPAPGSDATPRSEAAAQQEIRLAGSTMGGCLWRNNVGAFIDDTGIPVRFGLANDSKRVNKRVKSSDLIGFLPFKIAPQHVGQTLAVFMAIECKRGDWVWRNTAPEQAQKRYHDIVHLGGGCAGFARTRTDLSEIILSFEEGLTNGGG